MKKRILAIILVIAVMLTLVPMSVFANPTGVPQITIDSTTSTQDNTTWSWDAGTNTLTLKGINMSLSSDAGSSGISITGNGANALTTVNVVVTGNNVISGNTGILYRGSSATVNTINFSGTGSLRVSSGQACSMMLYRTTVNFNSGTYNLSNSSYSNDNIFVIDAAQTTCNFNGATVNMQAAPYGSGYFDGYYDGSEECANSNVYINSGSVTINTHGSNIATNKVVINGGTSDFHVGRTDRITISGNGGKTTINGGQVKKTGGLGLEQFQNNALNTLALTTLTISGVATPTAVTSLTTSPDLGYTYGTTDMKTNANGVIYAYLPTGKTSATVVAGGNTYTGAITSNAGTLTLLSTLTDISLAPVPIAYANISKAGTKVADLAATGTPTSGLTYSLDGSGANDSLFQINGTQLQIKSGATLAAQSYTVKVRVTDGTPDNTYTKQITFTANVRPQTYEVSAAYNMKNAKGVVATATFRGSPYGALYEAGDTATVTVTLSGTAMLTGTYTIGLTSTKAGTITAPATVTKTVTAGATPTDTFAFTFTMPANAVDDLEVTNTFVQAKSASPAATAATVAKTAITQATIDFTLDSAIEGTWKVYDAAANGNIVNGVTASTTGTALTLTHASNIPAGTYYVSVTEAGKTESTRLALTVGAYVAPTYTVSANTNAVQKNGVTATATFGASPYEAGATATVTITLSGTATATGTHTIGLTSTQAGTITPSAIVTKAVTAGANPTDTYAFTFVMPANAVDDLVVTHNFVQAQSTAPTASTATVAKTAATQAVVNFTLGSAIMGTWKVYDASTGGNLVSGITASAVGTTLSLTHASNIPAGTYYVSVTEAGKTESTRLALTVGAYVAPTYAVSATTNAVQKNGVTATANFGATPYVAGATATVTITLSGTATATGTHTVGLTSSADAGTITPPAIVTKAVTAGANPTDTYAFTFTMPANAVNDLVVTHDFVQAQSTAPTASVTTVAKTAATQAAVNFTLGSALTGTWKVYDSSTGGNLVSGITASAVGTTLSLTHASNIPAGTYYVSVTEAGKTESTRLALIVGAYVAPISAVSATTNAVQANGVTATATFGASPYVEGATATVTITLSGTATATGTHTVGLTSTKAGTITSPAIVTKTVTAGAVQTDTFAFTFTMPANAVNDLVVTHDFVQAQSTTPTASVTTVAKTAATQAAVNFTLGSALTGTWKVYDSSTGGNLVSGITASAVGTTLSLTHASNIPAGTYYVSVTEAGKTESTRLALIVGAYVAPSNNSGGGSSGSTVSSTPTPIPVKDDKVDVIFGKDTEKAATAKVEEKNNIKTTTVTLDATVVKENLDKMDQANTKENDKKVIIPVDNKSDVVVGELDGQTVKNMEDKNAVLEIKTENASYTLPAADIKIDAVPSQMGKQIELKDIKVSVKIADASSETARIVKDTAKKNSYTVVVKPVDFEITCTNGTKTVNVSKFNSYVERTVAIPNGIDPSKITTGVVVNSDGTFSHVPTTIVVIGGKYYAKINSLTNSTYTVISNPISFKDVEKHWAKEYVNDIGSRLIDSGVGNGNFAPDRAITRAEFASMIVKALGLRGSTFSEKFSDVKKGDPYYTAIYTAYEYGIISGYSNGKFGTQDLITRQDAMIMLSKAMKIAEMDASISETEISSQLKLFKDSGDISSYAKQGAAICIKYGIFGGNKGKLNPISNITRAESATIIIKLLKKAKLI